MDASLTCGRSSADQMVHVRGRGRGERDVPLSGGRNPGSLVLAGG
jgi:hypothetical protein